MRVALGCGSSLLLPYRRECSTLPIMADVTRDARPAGDNAAPAATRQPDSKPADKRKIADRPHPITVAMGLLSPSLALVSLGVSMYVFHDSQRSTRIAQRAYLSSHFEHGQFTIAPTLKSTERPFDITASASIRNVGNTPAYIESIKKELFLIDGDDLGHPIGEKSETSPNYEALQKGDSLEIGFDNKIETKQVPRDPSVVYRLKVKWTDVFGEVQDTTVFCGVMVMDWPAPDRQDLVAAPCMKGTTFTFDHK